MPTHAFAFVRAQHKRFLQVREVRFNVEEAAMNLTEEAAQRRVDVFSSNVFPSIHIEQYRLWLGFT